MTEDLSWTRAILNSSYDAFIAIDASGNVIDWNPQAEKTFGWRREQVLGTALDDTIIPPRHREGHRRGMKHFLATGEGPVLNKRFEIDALHRDGHEIPIELTIYPVQLGNALVFGSFLHDISERKRASSLQNAQLAVTTVLTEAASLKEAAPLLLERICKALSWKAGEFWIVDEASQTLKCAHLWTGAQSVLTQFQATTYSMTLSQGQGLPGRVWQSGEAEFITDVSTDPNFPRGKVAAAGGLQAAIAFPIQIENRISGVMGFYIDSAQSIDPRLLTLMSDIGKRIAHFILRRSAEKALERMNEELEVRVKERTQELESLNQQLRSANRLKDEFLATVSHELRTPLNVMQGYSDLLLGSPLSDEDRGFVEVIHRNALAQGHIINDLLDVSRIISGKLELSLSDVSLNEVVQAAFESVKLAAAAKKLQVIFDLEECSETVAGDFNRLQQVVWNLLTNAVKFTPGGGSIRITLRYESEAAHISIMDTGIGIEAEFLRHVFDRFRQEDATTTRKFGGLGLGLSIANHIMEAHGGNIKVDSSGKGLGATFTASIPFSKSCSVDKEVTSPVSVTPKKILQGSTILLVDDQLDAMKMIGVILQRAGAVVRTAGSVAEALESIRQQRPDIVVSDIGMPIEDGYVFISKLRSFEKSEGGSIPAIALTAYAYTEDQKRALLAGFQKHLAKPVEPQKLVESIFELLESKKS